MKKILSILVSLSLLVSTGCGARSTAGKKFRIGFMPKLVGIPYFTACERGAKEAAQELGIELTYDGPTKADSNLQNDLLSIWIPSGSYDCIAVACTERDVVSPTLKNAQDAGLPVVTYDADARPDCRDFFVNMASYDGVAEAMVESLIEQLDKNPTGKIGILTSSTQAPNQSEWAKRIKAIIQTKYPGLTVLPEVVHGEDRELGVTRARSLIQANPDLKGIIGLTSVAVPAAAGAVRNEKKSGIIKVTGVSTPREMKDFVQDGTVASFILWNPVDLGYLTVYVCHLLHQGKMPENGTIEAGRLGKITVTNREVLLGKPMRFDRTNIDQFDF